MLIKPVRTYIEQAVRYTPQELVRCITARTFHGMAAHEERVALLALRIYERVVPHKNGRDRMTVLLGGLFHDIGKNGVQDEILLKPGPLSGDEYAAIQTHVEKTEWVLVQCGGLDRVPLIAASHHERWDGTGYPRGLLERAIPYFTRIITIADIWDALKSERSYKKERSDAECLLMLQETSGNLCDPTLLELFLKEWRTLTAPLY